MKFTSDFETTTKAEDCRVWAVGLYNIDNGDFYCGNNIGYLFRFIEKFPSSSFYFHNLKFDGEFIIHHLLEHGWIHRHNPKRLNEKEFQTLISDKGQFYSIEMCVSFDRRGKRQLTTIYDSLKILPFSVEQIAIAFKLDVKKGELDYHAERPEGYILKYKDKSYLKGDVEIVGKALKVLFNQGLTKMTQGSNALFDFKKTIGEKNFNRFFPIPFYDSDIRQAYKGGFAYLNPKYKNKDVGEGIVLDVNSLYPSVMYYELLPYGEGIFFEGEYEYDEVYPLYTQMFTCCFDLKKDHIPTIQLKNNLAFIPTQYITSSEGEDVVMCLTSVDMELFFEHYDVYNIDYHSGWKFKASNQIFKSYIDKWNSVKVQSTIEGNHAMRTLAKLMLNALYGKFALNPNVQSKSPYLNEGVVKYKVEEPETRDPIYIPIGAFVTAYARKKTIESAQLVHDRFIYADTDSLHLEGVEVPEMLDVDSTKLGAWKIENEFKRGRFLRAKSYIEVIEDKLHITCAGMPSKCHKYVTWENFKVGSVFGGKLQLQHVKGGIVLKEIDFTIKE